MRLHLPGSSEIYAQYKSVILKTKSVEILNPLNPRDNEFNATRNIPLMQPDCFAHGEQVRTSDYVPEGAIPEHVSEHPICNCVFM